MSSLTELLSLLITMLSNEFRMICSIILTGHLTALCRKVRCLRTIHGPADVTPASTHEAADILVLMLCLIFAFCKLRVQVSAITELLTHCPYDRITNTTAIWGSGGRRRFRKAPPRTFQTHMGVACSACSVRYFCP